jgi:DNA-binding transcriptional MerR regulator
MLTATLSAGGQFGHLTFRQTVALVAWCDQAGIPTMSDKEEPLYRIGEVAERAGVTPRTLRYYQEVGLLDPSRKSPGGTRRYSEADVNRLLRIIELRNVMGFDLDRIREILEAEDRLAELREEAKRGTSQKRRREILAEAMALNERMQEQVREKVAVLEGFLGELELTAARYREFAAELSLAEASARD